MAQRPSFKDCHDAGQENTEARWEMGGGKSGRGVNQVVDTSWDGPPNKRQWGKIGSGARKYKEIGQETRSKKKKPKHYGGQIMGKKFTPQEYLRAETENGNFNETHG